MKNKLNLRLRLINITVTRCHFCSRFPSQGGFILWAPLTLLIGSFNFPVCTFFRFSHNKLLKTCFFPMPLVHMYVLFTFCTRPRPDLADVACSSARAGQERSGNHDLPPQTSWYALKKNVGRVSDLPAAKTFHTVGIWDKPNPGPKRWRITG